MIKDKKIQRRENKRKKGNKRRGGQEEGRRIHMRVREGIKKERNDETRKERKL